MRCANEGGYTVYTVKLPEDDYEMWLIEGTEKEVDKLWEYEKEEFFLIRKLEVRCLQ